MEGYEVSNLGNVRSSLTSYDTTFKGMPLKRRRKAGNLSGPKLSQKGYKRVRLNKRVYFVHRLIATAFIPNPKGLPQVNHKDGCKTNNDISNLEWVTNQENRDHAVATGLQYSKANRALRDKKSFA